MTTKLPSPDIRSLETKEDIFEFHLLFAIGFHWQVV